MKKIISFIIFCAVLNACGQDKGFMGYSTAFVKEDSIIEINHIGFADRENGVLYNIKTIQPVGSVSKTFIGVSLMIAQEKGLLDLDDDINKYLDFEFVNPHYNKGEIITLRHLATHTSGILDNEKAYESSYTYGLTPRLKLGDYLREYLAKGGNMYAKNNFSKDKPGTRYEYSNFASALAAYIVEKASGKPFDVFTDENIFSPLHMYNTGWYYKDISIANHAILYDEKDIALKPYSCDTYPDGSLKTTIFDLSIYLKELIKGYHGNSTLLTKDSWKELFEKNFNDKDNVKHKSEKEPNTGIFMMYFKSGTLGHTGSDYGVSAIMNFDPESGEGKIFMANEDITIKNMEEFKSIWNNIGQ